MPLGRTVTLEPYRGQWPPDDPDAGFRQLVAEYSAIDPMPTLEELGRRKDIPVGALAAFVLARYCASGSEALLYTGPVVVRQMDDIVRKAEAAGSDAAVQRTMATTQGTPERMAAPSTYGRRLVNQRRRAAIRSSADFQPASKGCPGASRSIASGAWSDGNGFPFRASRSISAQHVRSATGRVASRWSMRMPKFLWKWPAR